MPFEEAVKFNPKDDPYMEVCEHVSNVSKEIVEYFEKCNSIDNLRIYIDEMKGIEFVEDISFSTNTMFVKIKDFGTISYSYFPYIEENVGQEGNKYNTTSLTRALDINYGHSALGLENAAIINQVYFDESFKACRDVSEATCSILSDAGFRPVEVTSPKYEFFQRDIYNYDMIFLITHGDWDPYNKVHWILTSTETNEDEYKKIDKDKLYKYKDIPRDQVTIWAMLERRPNKVGINISKTIYYVAVSEKFIDMSEPRFRKPGSVIFFNTSCESIKGGIEYYGKDTDEKSDSFATILIEKGVGYYLGYDESNNVGHVAGLLFFGRLASGFSLERAYETLPYDKKHNEKKSLLENYVADLLPYPTDYSSMASATITCPWLNEYKDNSSNEAISISINASSRYYDKLLKNYGSLNNYYSIPRQNLSWGFEICTSPDFALNGNLIRTEALPENCTYENNRFNYTTILTGTDLKPGTTYYYRAYFYDGKYYNYSNSDSFTTPKIGNSGNTEDPNNTGNTGNTGNNAQTQDVPGSNL